MCQYLLQPLYLAVEDDIFKQFIGLFLSLVTRMYVFPLQFLCIFEREFVSSRRVRGVSTKEEHKEGEIVALFRIRMCARGTVIWPALYRPVYVVGCVLYVFLNGSSSVCIRVFGTSTTIQKRDRGACQCVRRRSKKKKKEDEEENRCRFNFDFRPIQIDRE